MPETKQTYPKRTGYSSKRYGPCEVCSGDCAEVFIARTPDHDYRFGHRECLEKAVRS